MSFSVDLNTISMGFLVGLITNSIKRLFFFADFTLQNMLETTLLDGLETSLILAYLQTFLSFCVLDNFFRFSKKLGFLCILGLPGNHASQWIRDLWSKGISLILAHF